MKTLLLTFCLLLTTTMGHAAENGRTLIIFSASWCPPCQQMKKDVFPLLKTELSQWDVILVDSDKFQSSLKAWKVESIPTIIFAKRENKQYATEVKRLIGYTSASELKKHLDTLLR